MILLKKNEKACLLTFGTHVQDENGGAIFRLKKDRSEIPVLPQPVNLWRQVPVDNITLIVLETPRRDNQRITFPDPDPLFDLPLDSSHAGYPVKTPHADMICAHHQVSGGKHLVRPLLWQPDADEWCTVRVYRIGIKIVTTALFLIIISNPNNSVPVYQCCLKLLTYAPDQDGHLNARSRGGFPMPPGVCALPASDPPSVNCQS